MDELKKTYVTTLAKMADVEETIIEHLPKLIQKSTNEELRAGLAEHLEETKEHRDRLKKILADAGAGSMRESEKPFSMMVENAGREIDEVRNTDVRDAVIIAAAQTVEHFEMAKYGTLVQWADQLNEPEARSLLKDTLDEEEAADKKLSSVAEGGIFSAGVNEKAAA